MTSAARQTLVLLGLSWIGLSAAAVGLVAAAGGHARAPYVLAVVGAALVSRLAVRRVGVAALPTSWPSEARPARGPGHQRGAVDGATMSLESALRRVGADPSSYERRLQPLLREVATHALRGQGIDPVAAPDAARAALGRDTWSVIYEHRAAGPRAVASAIERIESLPRR